ncbi:MAG: hypothetical protein U1F57_09435 [bacterium]
MGLYSSSSLLPENPRASSLERNDENVLTRSSDPAFRNASSDLSSTQKQVDNMMSRFVHEATEWKSLAAMMAGGVAYRLGKIGVIAGSEKIFGSTAARLFPLVQAASAVGGLATEVTVFEGTQRGLTALTGEAKLNPNLLNWHGKGGIKEGWLSSFVNFGTLKGFGKLAEGQNLLVQHAVQDMGMVMGHHVVHGVGFGEKPEGTLAEQFLHAEVTNLQLGAGASLAHQITGGRLLAFERGLDLAIRSRNFPEVAKKIETKQNRKGALLGSMTLVAGIATLLTPTVGHAAIEGMIHTDPHAWLPCTLGAIAVGGIFSRLAKRVDTYLRLEELIDKKVSIPQNRKADTYREDGKIASVSPQTLQRIHELQSVIEHPLVSNAQAHRAFLPFEELFSQVPGDHEAYDGLFHFLAGLLSHPAGIERRNGTSWYTELHTRTRARLIQAVESGKGDLPHLLARTRSAYIADGDRFSNHLFYEQLTRLKVASGNPELMREEARTLREIFSNRDLPVLERVRAAELYFEWHGGLEGTEDAKNGIEALIKVFDETDLPSEARNDFAISLSRNPHFWVLCDGPSYEAALRKISDQNPLDPSHESPTPGFYAYRDLVLALIPDSSEFERHLNFIKTKLPAGIERAKSDRKSVFLGDIVELYVKMVRRLPPTHPEYEEARKYLQKLKKLNFLDYGEGYGPLAGLWGRLLYEMDEEIKNNSFPPPAPQTSVEALAEEIKNFRVVLAAESTEEKAEDREKEADEKALQALEETEKRGKKRKLPPLGGTGPLMAFLVGAEIASILQDLAARMMVLGSGPAMSDEAHPVPPDLLDLQVMGWSEKDIHHLHKAILKVEEEIGSEFDPKGLLSLGRAFSEFGFTPDYIAAQMLLLTRVILPEEHLHYAKTILDTAGLWKTFSPSPEEYKEIWENLLDSICSEIVPEKIPRLTLAEYVKGKKIDLHFPDGRRTLYLTPLQGGVPRRGGAPVIIKNKGTDGEKKLFEIWRLGEIIGTFTADIFQMFKVNLPILRQTLHYYEAVEREFKYPELPEDFDPYRAVTKQGKLPPQDKIPTALFKLVNPETSKIEPRVSLSQIEARVFAHPEIFPRDPEKVRIERARKGIAAHCEHPRLGKGSLSLFSLENGRAPLLPKGHFRGKIQSIEGREVTVWLQGWRTLRFQVEEAVFAVGDYVDFAPSPQ